MEKIEIEMNMMIECVGEMMFESLSFWKKRQKGRWEQLLLRSSGMNKIKDVFVEQSRQHLNHTLPIPHIIKCKDKPARDLEFKRLENADEYKYKTLASLCNFWCE